MASHTTSPQAEPQTQHTIEIPTQIEPAIHDACCIYKIQDIIKIPTQIKPAIHGSCYIYKVSPNLRKNKEEYYTPHLISIGPFHHNNPELKPMHKQKQRYFHTFWNRVTNKSSFAKYKAFLKENVEMIRRRYSEQYKLRSGPFVDMILLDSVFILELFLRKYEREEKDYMFTTSWICKSIQRDLSLLENQIPIFVLEELYRRVYKDKSVSFLELAFNYFEDYNPDKSITIQEIITNVKSFNHFTDLIRYFYLPKKVPKSTPPKGECVLKTATKLNEAGVSFEKVQNKSLLDIKLKKTPILSWFLCLGCLPCFNYVKVRLQIPQLKVNKSTECVLRNLIALEQCHYSDQPYICNYVTFIDSLINTQEDVELLVDTESIVNKLGSHKELATMINGLCKNVVVTSNYYDKTNKKLNAHYNNRWMYYMGLLRSVYFRDPWRLSSTVVGVVFFLFAIVNFLRAAGLFHPKH